MATGYARRLGNLSIGYVCPWSEDADDCDACALAADGLAAQ